MVRAHLGEVSFLRHFTSLYCLPFWCLGEVPVCWGYSVAWYSTPFDGSGWLVELGL